MGVKVSSEHMNGRHGNGKGRGAAEEGKSQTMNCLYTKWRNLDYPTEPPGKTVGKPKRRVM